MNKSIQKIAILFFLSCLSLFSGALKASGFLPPGQAFQVQATVQDPNCNSNCLVDVQVQVQPGYYLYREKFVLNHKEPLLQAEFVDLPRGKKIYDQFLEKEIEALRGQLDFQIVYSYLKTKTENQSGVLTLSHQGCADAGLCYPPQKQDISLKNQNMLGGFFERFSGSAESLSNTFPAENEITNLDSLKEKAKQQSLNVADIDIPAEQATTNGINEVDLVYDKLSTQPLYVVLPIFFGLGLLLAFTPCTLPMLPIVTSLVVGDNRASTSKSKARALALAMAYVLGLAVTYAILGVLAGLTGQSLVVALQTPAVLWSFGGLLFLLGLLLLLGYQLQLPGRFQGWIQKKANRLRGGQYLPVFVMGMISALLLGPCVAPPLAGALLYIGQTGDAFVGAGALFLLALGMGLPMVVIAAGAGSVLPSTGQWMHATTSLFGFVLIAVALWVINPVTSSGFLFLFWTIWLIAVAASVHVFLARYEFESAFIESLWRGLSILFQLLALVYLIGLFSNAPSLLNPLSKFTSANASSIETKSADKSFELIDSAQVESFLLEHEKPVILDFYADWCVSCIEFKLLTLPDQEVQALLNGFTLIQVDVTKNTQSDQELLKKYGLYGPPAILFFNPTGEEFKTSRVVGFQNPEKFSNTLSQVRNQFGM